MQRISKQLCQKLWRATPLFFPRRVKHKKNTTNKKSLKHPKHRYHDRKYCKKQLHSNKRNMDMKQWSITWLTSSENPFRLASGAGCFLLTGMVSARDSGPIDGQMTPVSGTGRVRLCGHVKRSALNSAGYLEFPDRTVGTCATSSAWRRFWLRKTVHSEGSD